MGSTTPSVKYLLKIISNCVSEPEGRSADTPIYPIRDVKRSVYPQCCQVMCCNSLRLSSALKHKQLGQDRDGLQENGEGPEDLREVELVVEDEAENNARSKKVFDAESIDRRVMGWSGGRCCGASRKYHSGEICGLGLTGNGSA